MSACPQCGTAARPTDKFCNVCGTPIPRPSAQPGAAGAPPYGGGASPPFPASPPPGAGPSAYGSAPPGPTPPPYGTPQAPRCQMGHDIPPGANYCAQGHPIALDQMQFAHDAYGGGFGGPPPAPPGYGAAAPAPPFPYGAPPPAAFGVPPGYGAPAQPLPPFGGPPPQGYPPPPPPAFNPPPPPGYDAPGNRAPPFGAGHEASREGAPPKILRGFLVAYGTNPSGDFWPLTGGRLVVGRSGAGDGLDIPLQDPTISSRHAALTVDAATGAITIEDTGSTNGTFVNDEHIGFNGRRDLRDGDRIRFGGFTAIAKIIGRI